MSILNRPVKCNAGYGCPNKAITFDGRVKNMPPQYKDRLCQGHFDAFVFTCQGCEKSFWQDRYQTIDDDKWCSSCYQQYYFNCASCRSHYTIDLVGEVTDRDICISCTVSYYAKCFNCFTLLRRDQDLAECQTDNKLVCNDCVHLHPNHVFPVRGYNTFTGKKPSKIVSDRLVGVEVEAVNIDDYYDVQIPDCPVEDDGSLNSGGIEVQTPPASLSELEKFINRVCTSLKRNEAKIDASCGLHIHIDGRDFQSDSQKISQLLKTFLSVEDILFSTQPSSRRNNQYCRPLFKKYLFKDFNLKRLDTLERKWYKATDKNTIDDYKSHKYHDSRYYAINLHSLFYRGTVEIRMHAGTLSPDKIINWVNTCLTIVEYSLNNYDKDRIKSLYDSKLDDNKLRAFFDIFKMSNNLEKYIYSNVKRFNSNFNYQLKKPTRRPTPVVEEQDSDEGAGSYVYGAPSLQIPNIDWSSSSRIMASNEDD